MLDYVISKQKTKKYIIMNIMLFILFIGLYTIVDSLNLSYPKMKENYGWYLPIVNILLNIIMAILSTLMLTFTSAQFDFTKKESKGSSLSYLSVLFGILTYGCTPCVIAFFAAIGITFSVVLLPLANLPYKLISLLIVITGFIWIIIQIKKAKCKLE